MVTLIAMAKVQSCQWYETWLQIITTTSKVDKVNLPYLFKYNVQNCIPQTPTQSSVRVINEVLDFYAFKPEGTWVKCA